MKYKDARSLKILGYPVEHGNATFHEPFYHLAEKYNLKEHYFDKAHFDAGYTVLFPGIFCKKQGTGG